MGLSSHLTHVLVLSDLNKSRPQLVPNHSNQDAMYTRSLFRAPLVAVLWWTSGPLDGPGGPELTIRKWEKEANIPWFMQRTNKTLEQGLRRSWRHRAPSRGGLESPSRRVSSVGFHAPENQPEGGREREREGEREKERKTWGPKPLVEQGCFNDLSVSIYRLLYKECLLTMVKIRKPNVQQRLSTEQWINNGHKVRKQSISQERGSRLSSFVVRRMFTEGDSCMCLILWPQSWEQRAVPLVPVARNW